MAGKVLDLAGRRFGMLTALRQTDKTEDRYFLWECLCDCGERVHVNTKKLQRGTTANCGCVPKGDARKGSIAEDISGQRFGKLTATERAASQRGKTRWLCVCDCGNTKHVSTSMLKSGRTRHCGCEGSQAGVSNMRDLRGQRIGRLTFVEATEKRDRKGSVMWICRCDCGNTTEVTSDSLMFGNTVSCGCRQQEIKAAIGEQLTFVEDTCVEWLRSRKTRKDNTSGFRGVYECNGKWKVSIGFQGKRYSYGTYDSFEKAKAARLEIEKILHDDFVLAWEKWSAIAQEDPEWAQEYPFVFEVIKSGGKMMVYAPILDEDAREDDEEAAAQ